MLPPEPTASASGDVSYSHSDSDSDHRPKTRATPTPRTEARRQHPQRPPTITKDLNGGDEFVWVGHAAYNLAAAAILPFTGQLADIIGHRPIMLTCWLIAARTVQGIGGGGIITSVLVPWAERGLYQGLLVFTWAFAAGVGPVIKVTWRWLFYLNLPLAGIAFFLAMISLRVRTPEGSLREKIVRIDLVGNFIIIAGTMLALVALTWGGIRYPWSSVHVLAPLILGFLLIFLYEAIALICPQGRLAYQVFATASVLSSSAIVFGVLVRVMKKYRPVNVIGWVFLIGFGLFTLLKADSCTGEVGFRVITTIGLGVIWTTAVYPILAPLRPVARSFSTLAFHTFARTFAPTHLRLRVPNRAQGDPGRLLPPHVPRRGRDRVRRGSRDPRAPPAAPRRGPRTGPDVLGIVLDAAGLVQGQRVT
ncbi:uncharacterized protein BXZ73DRAFT_100965 [Epithele typhae]|uniref:uncharacterized protein n=1 Tax=Epithele typhae TaxID=378194 RepID=UPI0020089CC9|nr:uncharacterized protein BXZ73DRAFT_100965 [Epithele typhae]KAH9933581.1 hypothetical protein BXZ73DRAFT_100965 [Epithele typhae]